MTSQERFEAWLESRYPTTAKNPWKLSQAYKRGLFAAWSARDPEVCELVKALRTAEATFRGLAEVSPDFSTMRHWSGCANEVAEILANYESDGA